MANQASFFKMGGAVDIIEFEATVLAQSYDITIDSFNSGEAWSIDWGEGAGYSVETEGVISHTFTSAGTKTIKLKANAVNISTFKTSVVGDLPISGTLDLSKLINLGTLLLDGTNTGDLLSVVFTSTSISEFDVKNYPNLATLDANIAQIGGSNPIGSSISACPNLNNLSINSDVLFVQAANLSIQGCGDISGFNGLSNQSNWIRNVYIRSNAQADFSQVEYATFENNILLDDNNLSTANVDALIINIYNSYIRTGSVDTVFLQNNSAPTAASATELAALRAVTTVLTD